MRTKIEVHKDVCDGLHDLYVAKNHDYGDSFAKTREIVPGAILVRLHDKLNRLTALLSKPDQAKVKDESIDDTLRDLANYALMELVERTCERCPENCEVKSAVCPDDLDDCPFMEKG